MNESRECTERAGDAAAYVLGALDEEQSAAFLVHTASCVVCRDELIEFRQVSDALALAPPQYKVPRRVRRAVMREVAASAAAPSRERRRASDRRTVSRLPAFGRSRGLAAGLAAVALVVAGVEVLGASGSAGTRTVPASVAAPGAIASLRVTGTRADLVVEHLPAPTSGRIYELWTQRAHGPVVPTKALFSVNRSGDAVVEVPGGVKSVSEVLVTSEPAPSGSPHPTRSPIITAPVT